MSLQVGLQGRAVADVQQALKRHGFVAADRAGVLSGYAVRAFQAQHGLAATGVVDQATRRALGLRGSVPHPVPND